MCCGKLGDMMAYHLSGLTLEMESSYFFYTDHFEQLFYTLMFGCPAMLSLPHHTEVVFFCVWFLSPLIRSRR